MAVCYRESGLPVLGGKQSSSIINSLLNCKKIKSDIFSIRKPEKVYAAYGIPTDEVLLAYCKGTVPLIPLTMAGIIFTNKAVYFDPAPPSSNHDKIRKIPYSNLGKYILDQEGDHSPALAYTADDSIELYTNTIFATNMAAKETIDMLQKLQDELLASDSIARQQFVELGQSIITLAQEDIFDGSLSGTNDKRLEKLIHNPYTSDPAAKAKAECLYRSCNFSAYYNFVNSLPKTVSAQTCEALKAPDALFTEKLITDLSNMDNRFSKYSLEQKIGNLLHETSQSILSLRIISYCAIRLFDDKSFQVAMEHFQRLSKNKEITFFENQKAVYYNTKMLRVYNAIKNGKPIQEDWVSMHDSTGLTPLHYALILGAKPTLDQLLQLKRWCSPNVSTLDEIDWIYQYEVLAAGTKCIHPAALLSFTNERVFELEESVDRLMSEFGDSVKVLDMLSAQETRMLHELSRLERIHADYEEIQAIRDSLDMLYEEEKRANEENFEIFKKWEAAKEELSQITDELVSKAKKQYSAMARSQDSFVRYIYRIYLNPEFLHSVLIATSKESNVLLYKHGNLVFAAPDFAELDPKLAIDMGCFDSNEDTSDDLKHDHYSPIIPPHGTSWFSAKAHIDVAALKAEYRSLAKQYHPDVFHHPDSNTAMQQITAEYETLLRST